MYKSPNSSPYLHVNKDSLLGYYPFQSLFTRFFCLNSTNFHDCLNEAGVLEENLASQNCRQKYKMKLEHHEGKVEMLKMIFLRKLGNCKSLLVFFNLYRLSQQGR